MSARESEPYLCAGCGRPAVGRIRPCDCPTRVGYRHGDASVWLYDNEADASIASLGLDPEMVSSVRAGLEAAGYRILAPGELDGVTLEAAAKRGDAWDSPSELRLAAGEMTAQELRTVRAVARGIASAIRNLGRAG